MVVNFAPYLKRVHHFGQAHGTPFTVPPISEAIDFGASTVTAELILSGDYSNPDLDAITKLLISLLQARTALNAVSGLLTEAEFLGKLRVWNEQTSTSPFTFTRLIII